jgi:hypothetical protein
MRANSPSTRGRYRGPILLYRNSNTLRLASLITRGRRTR